MRTFMSDPRQIVPRKHASPMNTPGIRIREYWNGTTSSSDGPFFRASDRAAKRGDINLHYGSESGSKFFSHLSDQDGHFSVQPIGPTEYAAGHFRIGTGKQHPIIAID
ncbi:Tn3 family transposase [Bradyrhizobium hipponense]|nr:Tn3 family transposase [Bradyrhizobium hipponense]